MGCFPTIYIQCIFLLFVGEPFFKGTGFFFPLSSHLIALLNFECLLCFGTWALNETRRNYVKVSSLLDLCTSDIWKWDHCHVASLSKDSNRWIFHPRCLANLSCLHTDVHCIKTLFWPVGGSCIEVSDCSAVQVSHKAELGSLSHKIISWI